MTEIPIPELNPSAFSINSVQGILFLILAFFVIKWSSQKFVDIAFKLVGIILLLEILYILGQSPIDKYIGISELIKYDVFGSIAQLMPGTKLAEWLLTFGNILSNFLLNLFNWVLKLPTRFFEAL